MTMPSATSGARPRPGKNAFRPGGGATGDAPTEEASWPEMAAPLSYIYRRYFAEARWLLLGVAVIVFF
ncbi:MAG: hypothetical protein ABI398_00375, partial [Devosia sp.]